MPSEKKEILASARIRLIENVIELYFLFFKLSLKKQILVDYVANIRCLDNYRRQILIGMCKTRLSQRYLTYEHFYLTLPFIVEALEIINSIHAEMGSF